MARYQQVAAEQATRTTKTRQQQEDLRRMAFRRAVEAYAEQRQLQQELAEYPELIAADYLIAAHAAFRRNAPPAR
ncbi:transcriptional regulator [Pseudomonas cavernae]|uniref:Transcriptional regulator n=1 Tax=Pseudomonas cavernae TaxID=2320867 RepID=A0A385Z7Y8_9PSED|nr:transcriptional regulator [Pseudomonas cavernae]AYC34924.1 transcriptional regulator [Pseudomonas cavernae]